MKGAEKKKDRKKKFKYVYSIVAIRHSVGMYSVRKKVTRSEIHEQNTVQEYKTSVDGEICTSRFALVA